jgi:uncharacterized protein
VAGVSAHGRRSGIYVGSVHHRRHLPHVNAFRYGVYWTLIDVDELAELDASVRGFGYRRPAVTSFRDTDHFGPADVPVRLKLQRWLADRDLELPAGRVQVLTSLRVLGHVFNPVSWWYCYDADDRLALVVAEVDNTFGESHSYVLDLEHRPDGTVRATADKVFHVSPFLEVEGLRYRFTLRPPADRVRVRMDVRRITDPGAEVGGDELVLTATQEGRRVAFTGRHLASTLLRYPLVTLRTIYLIHRQAIRLWRARTPFHRKPTAPDDGYGQLGDDRPAGGQPTPAAIPPRIVTEPERTPKELAS